MSTEPKTIAVLLDASPSGEKRAAHAAALAQRFGARLIGIHVIYAGVTLPPSMAYARGASAIQHVITYERELDAAAEEAAARVAERFRALCASANVAGEFRAIGRAETAKDAFLNSLRSDLLVNSLHSDLLVVGHPDPYGVSDDVSAESLMLASGVPMLIVPDAWERDTIGERILIGWNATREAKRAISDSMAFLVAAKSVTVLVVDAARNLRHGEEPGADIALHLARHGVNVEVQRATSDGIPIAQVILERAIRDGSDLLVVGAYSHARLKELLLGGVTRSLLAQMPVPVLISR